MFTPLADPEAIRLWQKSLCEANNLTGRIIISPQGINGTVGGDLDAIKRYVKTTRSYPAFKKADIKWSNGLGGDFPKLSVKVRPEIVSFGAPYEISVDENGVVGGGTKLKPAQLHELVAQRGDDVVFFDGRNKIEAAIGKFKNAIVPDTDTTRDFLGILDSGTFDHLKDKTVVTYCTGGVRCEVLTALMKDRGFNDVYQLDGGIVRYGEKFGDRGLWEGSLYVFDKRMSYPFTENAKVLGRCSLCGAETTKMANYPDRNGRDLKVICEPCLSTADV